MPGKETTFVFFLLSSFLTAGLPVHASPGEDSVRSYPGVCEWKKSNRSATGRIVEVQNFPEGFQTDPGSGLWPMENLDGISPRSSFHLVFQCNTRNLSLDRVFSGSLRSSAPFGWINRGTGRSIPFRLQITSDSSGLCHLQATPLEPMMESSKQLFFIHSRSGMTGYRWLARNQFRDYWKNVDQCGSAKRLQALVKRSAGVHSSDLYYASEFQVRSHQSLLGPLLFARSMFERETRRTEKEDSIHFRYWKKVAGRNFAVVDGGLRVPSFCLSDTEECFFQTSDETLETSIPFEVYRLQYRIYIPDRAFHRAVPLLFLSSPSQNIREQTNLFVHLLDLANEYGFALVRLTDPFFQNEDPKKIYASIPLSKKNHRVHQIVQRMLHEQAATIHLQDHVRTKINRKYERTLIRMDRQIPGLGTDSQFSFISMMLNRGIHGGVTLDRPPPDSIFFEKDRTERGRLYYEYSKLIYDPIHPESYRGLLENRKHLPGLPPKMFYQVRSFRTPLDRARAARRLGRL